ncbi:hypothetical protein, partial [Amphritea pacifica]
LEKANSLAMACNTFCRRRALAAIKQAVARRSQKTREQLERKLRFLLDARKRYNPHSAKPSEAFNLGFSSQAAQLLDISSTHSENILGGFRAPSI